MEVVKKSVEQDKDTGKKRVLAPSLCLESFEVHPDAVNGTEAKVGISQNVFIPAWDNKPEDVKPVLSLCGVPILTHQNTGMIIALPGVGKSSICESIGASYLNKEADCLGFSVPEDCRGIIYIDNERTNIDVWNSFNRMMRRAGIPYGQKVENIVIAGLRSVPRLQQRLDTIIHLLETNPCSLLLIDGLGDLVTDSNDLLQAIECRIWLREVTVKYDLSILTTIHPNPGGTKPRGHAGAEGHRESESVLQVKKVDGDVRIITTDFEHGKNRNNDKITAAFRWSDEQKMFVSVDPDSISVKPKNSSKRTLAELLASKLLAPPKALSYTDFLNDVMQHQEASESTGKRLIKDMVDFEFIKKHDDGYYRAII